MKFAKYSCSLLVLLTLSQFAHTQVTNFQHVIVVFQENRTPDNLFQGLCVPPYGSASSCSIAPTGKQYNIQTSNWLDSTSPTGVTQPTPLPMVDDYDMHHDHASFVAQCNKDANGFCRMDGNAGVVCVPSSACTAYAHPGFKYVSNGDSVLNPYLDMATQYGWANYMFQTNQGSSYPAHLYIFGGTSAPSLAADHSGTFASENPYGPHGQAGCTSDPNVMVQLIDANGVEDPTNIIYPCFEYNTIGDLLSFAGVSWRYYAPGVDGIWTPPNTISHICRAIGGKCTGAEFANVDPKSADILTDIAACNLRQVNWVVPTGNNSDHARDTTGGGPAWVASIVNAIGNSWSISKQKCDYWGNNTHDATAIIVTWDDWGGWYDHEPPAILPYPQGGYQNGFRVPLLFISAYTSPGFVSNQRYDFGSIIRFIEQNYGIQEGALSFADARATTDLTTFFSFTQGARKFRTIPAPQGFAYFVNDTRPQTPPDDD